ncbi:MAG: hypothetical protein EOP88_02805 [Verrucomicrobiaceae bacterium]|nr:MAG: hypothetical protein EOP88_02805 [Verrucomicrobiaceae bacterium]
MKPEDDPLSGFDEFTTAQKVILAEAVVLLEARIYRNVVNKLRNFIAVGILVLTGFGVFSIAGIRDDVVKLAAANLSSDPQIRGNVEKRSIESLELDSKTLKEAKERVIQELADIRKEREVKDLFIERSSIKLSMMIDRVEQMIQE